MEADLREHVARFLSPERVWRRQDALSRPSPIPATAGVYGWRFDTLPASIDVTRCRTWRGLILLYTGISPKRPPMNGRPPSKSHLRQRIETHYTGNAEGSTLRKTLGCLLAGKLGIQLRRVGSGSRHTFGQGEQALSTWMAEHAFVSVVGRPRGWELEDHLIAPSTCRSTLSLIFNLWVGCRGGGWSSSGVLCPPDGVARARVWLPEGDRVLVGRVSALWPEPLPRGGCGEIHGGFGRG